MTLIMPVHIVRLGKLNVTATMIGRLTADCRQTSANEEITLEIPTFKPVDSAASEALGIFANELPTFFARRGQWPLVLPVAADPAKPFEDRAQERLDIWTLSQLTCFWNEAKRRVMNMSGFVVTIECDPRQDMRALRRPDFYVPRPAGAA